MTTSKNFTIRFVNDNTVEVSRTFQKNAAIFGTPEYKLWREFRQENSEVTMTVPKSKSKSKSKEQNKNGFSNLKLTYDNMTEYISSLEKSDALMKEFKLIRQRSKITRNPYRFVLAWFCQKFEYLNSYEEFFNELKVQLEEEDA